MEAGSIQHEAKAWEMDRTGIVDVVERAMVADGRTAIRGRRPNAASRNAASGPGLQPDPAGLGTTASPPFVPWVLGPRQALRPLWCRRRGVDGREAYSKRMSKVTEVQVERALPATRCGEKRHLPTVARQISSTSVSPEKPLRVRTS